jgi:hypothetical protein
LGDSNADGNSTSPTAWDRRAHTRLRR